MTFRNRIGSSGVKIIYAPGYNPPAGRGRRDRGDAVATAAADTNLISDAVAAAKSADVVIYVGGLNHNGGYDTEGSDRRDLKLPGGQDELLEKIVRANRKRATLEFWSGFFPGYRLARNLPACGNGV